MLRSAHARQCWRACEAPLSGGLRAGSWLCVALFLIVHPNSGAADADAFVAVLANPTAFHDKPVAIAGYLNKEHEGQAIYLSRDAFTYRLGENALWLDISRPSAAWDAFLEADSGALVRVHGVLDATETGHFGSFAARIHSIHSIILVGAAQKAGFGCARP